MSLLESPVFFLAAGLFDGLAAAIPVILLVFWILGRILNQEEKPPARRQAPGARGAGGAARPAVPAGGRDPRDEVERFLQEVSARRRVASREAAPEVVSRSTPSPAQRRASLAQSSPIQRPAASTRPARLPVTPRPVSTAAKRVAAGEQPLEAQVLREPLGSGIEEHVRSRLPAPQLLATDMERRGGAPPGPATEQQAPVSRGEAPVLARLLRSPADVRQAIVLNEILSPPLGLRGP